MRFPALRFAPVRSASRTADDGPMTNNNGSSSGQVADNISPRDVFLTLTEVAQRYRWGRTKTAEMRRTPGFPKALGGVYRLDTLQAWEDRLLAAEADLSRTIPAPRRKPASEAPAPPARKRPIQRREAEGVTK